VEAAAHTARFPRFGCHDGMLSDKLQVRTLETVPFEARDEDGNSVSAGKGNRNICTSFPTSHGHGKASGRSQGPQSLS